MTDDKKGDYEIGYGKPPKHTRFLPGTSGFKGRKKKRYEPQANMIARVRDELVTVGGNTMTKGELAVVQTLNQTIKSGKPRDLKLLLDLFAEYGAVPEGNRYAEEKEGARKVMEKIALIAERTFNVDPTVALVHEKGDEEEAVLIMSCPHCSEALRQRWGQDSYKEFAKRHGKSKLHRQVEEMLRKRERPRS